MLDNFGMGELLVLVFFAILFFGPERLPQMGAKVGKWLAQLTQYSKQFMNQWTEEAAAVQDAMFEIQGIRDEIRAAQSEISQSLNTARQDITETIDEARSQIKEATPTTGSIMERRVPPGPATSEGAAPGQPSAPTEAGDEGAAIAKTQEIMSALLQTEAGGEGLDDQANGDEAQSAELSEEDAYEKNLRAIKEIMGRSKGHPVTQDGSPAEAASETEAVRGDMPAGTTVVESQLAQEEKAEKKESPFDKTQRILDQLMGIEAEPEPEPEPEPAADTEPVQELAIVPAVAAASVAAAAGSSASDAPAGDASDAAPPAEPAHIESPVAPTDGVQRVQGLETGVSSGQFRKLSVEVGQLRGELRKLRQELVALRATQASQPAGDPSDGAEQAKDSSDAMPVEEVA